MARKLDYEALQREVRANKQGREFSGGERLSERQKDQLQQRKQDMAATAEERKVANSKSLIAGLLPTTLEQAEANLKTLLSIVSNLSAKEGSLRALTFERDIRKLQAQIKALRNARSLRK